MHELIAPILLIRLPVVELSAPDVVRNSLWERNALSGGAEPVRFHCWLPSSLAVRRRGPSIDGADSDTTRDRVNVE